MSIVIMAWVSALFVFTSFFMKTMVRLRIVAIGSNVGFISYGLLGLRYGVFGQVYPILVLHSSLLPLNIVRLRQLTRLVASVRHADEFEAIQALIPYTKTERRGKGDVLFTKGDPADKLYIVQKGTVAFPEFGTRVSVGGVFGEVGLFAPQGRRTAGAVCEEECQLATITREKVLELYYQNPKFGLFLIRLAAGYLGGNGDRVEPSPAELSLRVQSKQRIRLLGELALRVNDLATMLAFYRDVVGLEVWREYADCVFFRIADGVEGHPQTLVLFDRNVEVGRERSTIDHFAFVIELEDYDERRRQLERLGLEVRPKEFPLFHWRSLFIVDLEGNTVEFVCYDPSV